MKKGDLFSHALIAVIVVIGFFHFMDNKAEASAAMRNVMTARYAEQTALPRED